MDHTSRSMEDSGADCELVTCGGLLQEDTEENFSMFPRDCSCNILVKKVAAFAFGQLNFQLVNLFRDWCGGACL